MKNISKFIIKSLIAFCLILILYLCFFVYNYYKLEILFYCGSKSELKYILLERDNTNILKKKFLNKNNPLHIACIGGNIDAVNIILSSIYSNELFEDLLSSTNKYGKTPYDVALEHNYYYISRLLLSISLTKEISDVNKTDQDIINKIEEEKLIINARLLSKETTLLNDALFNNRIELTKYLLKKGANPNIQIGNSTLLGIILSDYRDFYSNNQYEIVKLLLENGADPNFPCFGGITPFMTACKYNRDKKIINLLLEYNTRIYVTDFGDRGPLDYWYNRNETLNNDERTYDILALLLKSGANPYRKNKFNEKSFIDVIKEKVNKGNFEEQILNVINEEYKLKDKK